MAITCGSFTTIHPTIMQRKVEVDDRQVLINFYENLRDEEPKKLQNYIYFPNNEQSNEHSIKNIKVKSDFDKDNLNQFFKKCDELSTICKQSDELPKTPEKTNVLNSQKSEIPIVPVFSKGYCPENFESMKISYNPSLKSSVTAKFDGIVETCLEKIAAIDKNPNLKGDTATLLKTINKIKSSIINHVGAQYLGNASTANKWRELGLEEWLDKRINAIDLSDKEITLKEINDFNIKFWKDCSAEWIKEKKLEKYTPNKNLQNRINKLTRKLGLKYPDCRVFAACYLNMENQIKKTSTGIPNLILRSDRHCLVTKPLANDLIMYLDSNNTPIHFAVCLDPNRVIAKNYDQCILIHDIEDVEEGTSYIVVRTLK